MTIDQQIARTKNLVFKAWDRIDAQMRVRALREFGAYQQSKLAALFSEAVQEFYAAYTPSLYSRQYGLYETLDLKIDSDGTVLYDTAIDLVDASKMHGDRNGGDLFRKVFEQGWHGGAESGPDGETGKDDHPSPGTPYYRTPHPYYRHWGQKAIQTESPLDILQRKLDHAEGGEMFSTFKQIFNKYRDESDELVRSKIVPSVIRRVWR